MRAIRASSAPQTPPPQRPLDPFSDKQQLNDTRNFRPLTIETTNSMEFLVDRRTVNAHLGPMNFRDL